MVNALTLLISIKRKSGWDSFSVVKLWTQHERNKSRKKPPPTATTKNTQCKAIMDSFLRLLLWFKLGRTKNQHSYHFQWNFFSLVRLLAVNMNISTFVFLCKNFLTEVFCCAVHTKAHIYFKSDPVQHDIQRQM